MHSIWFGAVRRQKLWEMLQAQQLHYTRFRMLDFITETDFMRIIGEHEELFRLIEKKDQKGLEAALKEHLYFSMKRMRHSIEVDYKIILKKNQKKGGLSFDRPLFSCRPARPDSLPNILPAPQE